MHKLWFNSLELQRLGHVDYRAQILYLHVIKPRMDYKTGISGLVCRISEQACKEHLEIHRAWGSTLPAYVPTRGEIRAALVALERHGLIERVPALQMTWRCVANPTEKQFFLNPTERDALLYQDHRAQMLYLHVLRPPMDPQTGVAGTVHITGAIERLRVQAEQGSNNGYTPTVAQIRASLAALERTGLIEKVPKTGKAIPYRLPLASHAGQLCTKMEPTHTNQKHNRGSNPQTPSATPIDSGGGVVVHTHEQPGERTKERPTSLQYINNNTAELSTGAYCLTLDWQPSAEFLQRLKSQKIRCPASIVLSFVLYWTGPTTKGRAMTQHEWEARLLEQIIMKTQPRNSKMFGTVQKPKDPQRAQKPPKTPQKAGEQKYSPAWRPFAKKHQSGRSQETGNATLAKVKAQLFGRGGCSNATTKPVKQKKQYASVAAAIHDVVQHMRV